MCWPHQNLSSPETSKSLSRARTGVGPSRRPGIKLKEVLILQVVSWQDQPGGEQLWKSGILGTSLAPPHHSPASASPGLLLLPLSPAAGSRVTSTLALTVSPRLGLYDTFSSAPCVYHLIFRGALSEPVLLDQELANFSVKGPRVNILGFVGQALSVTAAQLGPCSWKAATAGVRVGGRGCVPIKLYLQNQAADRIWLEDCSLLPLPPEIY